MNQSSDHEATRSGDSNKFPPTLWTIVLEASKGDSPQSSEALGKLCEIYHQPILAWLVRRGTPESDAEDLTQNFARGKTKFRSFLLECLLRFSRDEWRKATAQKRGSGREVESIEEGLVGASVDLERDLDRGVALAIHRRVLDTLRDRYARKDQERRFGELRGFLFGGESAESQTQVAQRLGLSPGATRKAVFDLREAYCDFFRMEVSQIAARESLDEEMRYLLTLLVDTDATAAEA